MTWVRLSIVQFVSCLLLISDFRRDHTHRRSVLRLQPVQAVLCTKLTNSVLVSIVRNSRLSSFDRVYAGSSTTEGKKRFVACVHIMLMLDSRSRACGSLSNRSARVF